MKNWTVSWLNADYQPVIFSGVRAMSNVGAKQWIQSRTFVERFISVQESNG